MEKRHFLYTVSTLSALVGVLVIFGWFFNIEILKSIIQDHQSKMVITTAFSFILVSCLVYLFAKSTNSNSKILKTITLVLLFLNLIFLLVSFIDMTHPKTIQSNYLLKALFSQKSCVPAQIAFTLMSFFVVLEVLNIKRREPLKKTISFAVFLIGAIALLGHAINNPILYYSFIESDIRMAPHTAFLFILNGIAFLVLSDE